MINALIKAPEASSSTQTHANVAVPTMSIVDEGENALGLLLAEIWSCLSSDTPTETAVQSSKEGTSLLQLAAAVRELKHQYQDAMRSRTLLQTQLVDSAADIDALQEQMRVLERAGASTKHKLEKAKQKLRAVQGFADEGTGELIDRASSPMPQPVDPSPLLPLRTFSLNATRSHSGNEPGTNSSTAVVSAAVLPTSTSPVPIQTPTFLSSYPLTIPGTPATVNVAASSTAFPLPTSSIPANPMASHTGDAVCTTVAPATGQRDASSMWERRCIELQEKLVAAETRLAAIKPLEETELMAKVLIGLSALAISLQASPFLYI